jgi:hypothetical protein
VWGVLLDSHIGVGIEVGDLFAAVVPQALQSIAQRCFAVYLEDVLLQSLQIMQLRCTVVPFAFVGLEMRCAVGDTG